MKFRMALTVSSLLFAFALCAAQGKEPIGPRQLTSGQTIERKISGSESQSYRLNLQRGEFLRVVVTSHNVDIVATLSGPDGQKLLTVDLLKYPGPEPLSFSVSNEGVYRLEVRAAGTPKVNGSYVLMSEVRASATANDKDRQTAEQLLLEANALESEGSKESLEKSIDKRGAALGLWRKLSDRYWEAYALHYSGRASSALNKNQEALAFYNQALSIRKEIGDRFGEAATLNNTGLTYVTLGEHEKATEYFNQAVAISRTINDRLGEARTLGNLGIFFEGLGEKQKALGFYHQVLTIYRAVGSQSGEAGTLIYLGNVYYAMGEKQKALEFYNPALPIYQAVGDKSGEANTLTNIGLVYYALSENQRALEFYNQALPIYRILADKSSEANALINIGNVYYALGQKQKALEFYNPALPIYRAINDTAGEANALINLGNVYSTQGKKQIALEFYNQALLLKRAAGDKNGEAITLINLGDVYAALGDKKKSLEFYNQALPLKRAVGDKGGEANTLISGGLIYVAMGDKQGLELFNQALPIYRGIGDKKGEAKTLLVLGLSSAGLGDKQKGLDFLSQALSLTRAIGDKKAEAGTLLSLGVFHYVLGEKQKAPEFFNQALQLVRAIGDKSAEAIALMALGTVDSGLGEKQKALEFYDQALSLRRTIGDKSGEAETLNSIGNIYVALGEKQKALEFYNQALPLKRAVADKSGEADILGNLGLVHSDLGEPQKALAFYHQALSLRRALGDKSGEATTLTNIGKVYDHLGDPEKAKTYYRDALALNTVLRNPTTTAIEPGATPDKLPTAGLREASPAYKEAQRALIVYLRQVETSRQLNIKSTEASALTELMFITWALDSPTIAISYGKQAVNAYQELRAEMSGSDLKLQSALLRSAESAYRKLADILIDQGRIPEAEQVLEMLKQEEVFDYVRRDASELDKLQKRTDLSDQEREALKRYNGFAERVAALGAEFGKLQDLQSKGTKLTAEQEKRYQELAPQIEDASRSFQAFLRQLAEEFAKRTNTRKDLEESLGLQADLKSWGEGVVFLYTLVDDDRYRVVLVTPDTQVDGKYEIKLTDLDEKIAKFRAAVTDPHLDPRPLGKELYDILIKPIEKQLEGAHAKTLLWSLDGNLRLLPLAALWDGNEYFGQKYQNVTITLASRTRLGEVVAPDWSALGLGASQGKSVSLKELGGTREVRFEPLPAVRTEIFSIVRSEQSPKGVLPGQSLIDAEFNEGALETQLLRGYKVIHIASHFSLNPGDSTKSFLLLGDGNVLTMDEMKNNPRLKFNGVELLTLSACQTAVVEKDSSGKEIEGFGYVAQQKGAKAILATLWSVADESTQLLMAEFYRLRKENPHLTKAEAMQRAQQAMLAGKLAPTTAESKRRADIVHLTTAIPKDAPAFKYDAMKPYAHPYYWAPFILIGNWK